MNFKIAYVKLKDVGKTISDLESHVTNNFTAFAANVTSLGSQVIQNITVVKSDVTGKSFNPI